MEQDLEAKTIRLLGELDPFMNDDFGTAKVLANIFELVPTINSMKDRIIPVSALTPGTFELLRTSISTWIVDILGLTSVNEADNEKLQGVMQLLIDIRKEAKNKKDFATSDKIRNQLSRLGITLKDEKSGEMTWNLD